MASEAIQRDCNASDTACVFERVYPCLTDRACRSSSGFRGNVDGVPYVTEDLLCAAGYDSDWVLCDVCSAGSYRSWDGRCRECSSRWEYAGWAGILMLIVLATLVLTRHLQTTGLLREANKEWKRRQLGTKGVFEIWFSALQLPAQTRDTYSDAFIPDLFHGYLSGSHLLVSPLALPGLTCLGVSAALGSFYWTFALSAAVPMLLMLAVLSINWRGFFRMLEAADQLPDASADTQLAVSQMQAEIRAQPSEGKQKQLSKKDTVKIMKRISSVPNRMSHKDSSDHETQIMANTVAGFLLRLIHPSVSTCMFQLMHCTDFHLDGSKQWWLHLDKSIECYDSTWWIFAAIGFAVIALYVVGMPLSLFMLTRDLYDRKMVIDSNGETHFVKSNRLSCHSGEWHLHCHDHSPVVVPVLRNGADASIRGMYSVLETEVVENLLGGMTMPFRHELHWWPVYSMVRKVMQSSFVMVVQYFHNEIDLFYSLSVTLLSMGFHAYMKPYLHNSDNVLGTLVHLGDCFTLLSFIGVKANNDTTLSDATSQIVLGMLLAMHVVIIRSVYITYREMIMNMIWGMVFAPKGSKIKCPSSRRIGQRELLEIAPAATMKACEMPTPQDRRRIVETNSASGIVLSYVPDEDPTIGLKLINEEE
eukprot:gene22404-27032_t